MRRWFYLPNYLLLNIVFATTVKQDQTKKYENQTNLYKWLYNKNGKINTEVEKSRSQKKTKQEMVEK